MTAYTELLEESRQEAIDRMIVKAESLGADAVVGLRFSTSSIAQELLSYLFMVLLSKRYPCRSSHFKIRQAILIIKRVNRITQVNTQVRKPHHQNLLMSCHVSILLVR